MDETLLVNGIRKANSLAFYEEYPGADGDNDTTNNILEQRIGNESPSSYGGNSPFPDTEAELPNEISAPYEVPQFPIEQIEKKLQIQRQLNTKALDDRRSHYEPSIPGAAEVEDLDEHELYVPHFQRVSISGEDTSGVPLEDLERASKLLIQALEIRKRYMKMSSQNFSSTAARFLDPDKEQQQHDDKQTIEEHGIHHPPTTKPWEAPEIPDTPDVFVNNNGVYNIYPSEDAVKEGKPRDYTYPDVIQFTNDFYDMCNMIADGPLKSFCYRRLSYLSSKFQLHVLLNELRELASQKAVPHRDFYNIRKVDTHIHAASCMNQKHLLRFIKKALKTHADEVVTVTNGRKMTLKEVFQVGIQDDEVIDLVSWWWG